MKDSTSGIGVVRLVLLAVILLVAGAGMSFVATGLVFLASCLVAGVLVALYLKRRIAYLYPILYVVGYMIGAMLQGSSTWQH